MLTKFTSFNVTCDVCMQHDKFITESEGHAKRLARAQGWAFLADGRTICDGGGYVTEPVGWRKHLKQQTDRMEKRS
jgi:hypothetical protein